MTVTSRCIFLLSSSNDTPPSPPYHVGIKIKSVPEYKYNEELTTGIEDDSTYSSLVIDDYLKMGEIMTN